MCEPLPSTVDEAVERLLAAVPATDQAAIAAMSESELDAECYGLAISIRNEFGLWSGNDDLLADTGALDPDGASAVVVRAFWARLRKSARPRAS